MLCMRLILFYQKHLSKHTCLYRPTCSQYTLECINNHGRSFRDTLGRVADIEMQSLFQRGIRSRAGKLFQKALGALNFFKVSSKKVN